MASSLCKTVTRNCRAVGACYQRSFSSVGNAFNRDTKRSSTIPPEFTQSAWKAIYNSPAVARSHKLEFAQAETIILALLEPKHSITKEILKRAKCSPMVLESLILDFMKKEPKRDWTYFSEAKPALSFHDSLMRAVFTDEPNPNSILVKESVFPTIRYGPFLREANSERIEMGDSMLGEEHLVLAFRKELRCGADFMKELYVSEYALKNAVKEIVGSSEVQF